MAADPNERILVPKQFTIGPDQNDHEEDDDLYFLKQQRPVKDQRITIQDDNGNTVGEVTYEATWIYNKRSFLEELRDSMKIEKETLVQEIKVNDKKLRLISDPFGGYRNVLEVDDIHFEDAVITPDIKAKLKVSAGEEAVNQKFNAITNNLGMKNTRWGRLTITMFGIWSILTSITCFQKADFLNLTIAIIGLMMFLDP